MGYGLVVYYSLTWIFLLPNSDLFYLVSSGVSIQFIAENESYVRQASNNANQHAISIFG